MADSATSKRAHQTLDCIGLYCPMPVLNTRQAIDELRIGEILKVLADDPAAKLDFKSRTKRTGQKILEIEKTDEGLRFFIQGFNHSIYAHDPNGIPINFSHNVEEVDIREKPQMRDKAPSKITLEVAEAQSGIRPKVTIPTPESERMVYQSTGSELFHGKKSI